MALALAIWPTAGAPALAAQASPASPAASARALSAGSARALSAGSTRAAAAGNKLKLRVDSAVETVQGAATTLTLPGAGGDYVRVHTLGTIGVSAPDGRTVWQVSTAGLLADWHLRLARNDPQTQADLQPPMTRQSPSPSEISAGQQDGVADAHPVAAGYLAGSRVPVVAVAETAGAGVGTQATVVT